MRREWENRVRRRPPFARAGFVVVPLLGASLGFGQFRGGWFRVNHEVKTAREVPSRSMPAPIWDNPPQFGHDVFVFTRLRYGSTDGYRGGGGEHGMSGRTKHRSCAEAVRRVNRITRGWSNYYHYGHCTRVFGRQQNGLLHHVRRWLGRKYGCKHGLFSFLTNARLLGQYHLWPLPLTAPWRRSLCDVCSRKAGCGKSARPV